MTACRMDRVALSERFFLTLSGLHKATPVVVDPTDVSGLELLAHYELVDEESGRARSGFAVLLELTERRLMLEGDVPLKAGDQLRMDFFLPDSGSDAGRTKVSLRCQVAQCMDVEHLHYGASISKIGEASRKAIGKLHAERRSGDPT